MNKLMQGIQKFWKEEEGTEVVEWALVASLIVAIGAGMFATLGGDITTVMTTIGNTLNPPG